MGGGTHPPGPVLAGGEALEWGRLANTYPPVLRTHDRYGERIDEVEFHPAWHQLMRAGVELGLHASPWREPQPDRTSRGPRRSCCWRRPSRGSAVRSR